MQALSQDDVENSAQASLAAVKADRAFFTRFERGEIEMSTDAGMKVIKADDNKVYAAIIRGGEFDEGSAVGGDSRKAALIVKVIDIAAQNADQNGP